MPFRNYIIIKFVKNANSCDIITVFPVFHIIGLATVGVCVFSASASADALFLFYQYY